MEIDEFCEVLLMGVAIGLALGMALRWIGRKLLSRNQGGLDMRVPTQQEIERTREWYEGKRIELIEMPEDPDPVKPGTVGTCEMVDGAGQLIMKWDDGRTLNLIPGVDHFKVL